MSGRAFLFPASSPNDPHINPHMWGCRLPTSMCIFLTRHRSTQPGREERKSMNEAQHE